ncbi:DUF1697 domain-containing protein [Sphingomonas sp. ID1715]|uniref:DUF1697 domain-containing protein n=1 Tax=Sphingomonas sp. ID1715 TaxID=1656898 RepID=UPI001489C836|nr:DUF1697 domain-containing protein [Sphingomonas sp. ID1715]NNM75765.1 DUF1697 domain-containing protein [Sphingomonas sp. ID1715]
MTAYVALLRAVNVGGFKLPMAELKAMCDAAGFEQARTYIASGNAVFGAVLGEAEVKSELEGRLKHYAGKPVAVLVRDAAAMRSVLADSPFPGATPSRTFALFFDEAPTQAAIDDVRHREAEEIRLGRRELYIHYPEGMGSSKLVIPAARLGTARNMNTVAKLAQMASELA